MRSKAVLCGSGQEHASKVFVNETAVCPTIGCTDLGMPRMIEIFLLPYESTDVAEKAQ